MGLDGGDAGDGGDGGDGTDAETAEMATDPKTIPPAIFQKLAGFKNMNTFSWHQIHPE